MANVGDVGQTSCHRDWVGTSQQPGLKQTRGGQWPPRADKLLDVDELGSGHQQKERRGHGSGRVGLGGADLYLLGGHRIPPTAPAEARRQAAARRVLPCLPALLPALLLPLPGTLVPPGRPWGPPGGTPAAAGGLRQGALTLAGRRAGVVLPQCRARIAHCWPWGLPGTAGRRGGLLPAETRRAAEAGGQPRGAGAPAAAAPVAGTPAAARPLSAGTLWVGARPLAPQAAAGHKLEGQVPLVSARRTRLAAHPRIRRPQRFGTASPLLPPAAAAAAAGGRRTPSAHCRHSRPHWGPRTHSPAAAAAAGGAGTGHTPHTHCSWALLLPLPGWCTPRRSGHRRTRGGRAAAPLLLPSRQQRGRAGGCAAPPPGGEPLGRCGPSAQPQRWWPRLRQGGGEGGVTARPGEQQEALESQPPSKQ